MIFSTPNEVFLAHSQNKVGVHALIKLRLPAHKRLRGRRREGVHARHDHQDDRRPRGLQRHPPRQDAVLQPDARARSSSRASSPTATRSSAAARRSTLLDRMKDLGFRESTRSGLSFATDDLKTPPNEGRDHRRDREGGRQGPASSLPARHHHRAGALQQGPRRLDARPRADHHGDDGSTCSNDVRDGEAVPEPDLPDGRLRRPRRRRADPPAGRHARPDGQALRQDHRDADQGQLPRRAVGARVLQLDARRPQGAGRHGPEDGRLAAT